MVERTLESDTSVKKNWSTPIGQISNHVDPTQFDGYVLIAKKGDEVQLYTNYEQDSKESSLLFQKADQAIQSEM